MSFADGKQQQMKTMDYGNGNDAVITDRERDSDKQETTGRNV